MTQVKVSEGILEGERVQNPYGGEFHSFKGIPYAEPPLGDLRFKAPQPKRPWKGVREAKACGLSSRQNDLFSPDRCTIGSEDCLYLNVFTPNVNPTKPLPVMVFIHPGGFNSGSGDDDFYGPQFLIKEDVILVTINYRLGVLGFLCLHTEDIPGNAGMKDQVVALKWINKNIGNFGGDPDNVTIFGVSAGGMSASFHMVSPMAKGLFKRVISQSGTALTPVLCDPYARERGLALAKRLGCKSENDKEIYEFLKRVPVDDLLSFSYRTPLTLLEDINNTKNAYFTMVVENVFEGVEPYFTQDMSGRLKESEDETEILLGYAEHEGACYLINEPDLQSIPDRCNTFSEFFVPKQLLPMNTIDAYFEIARKVKEFYFKNEEVTMKNLIKLVNFYTFEIYGFPVVQWAKLCARRKNSKVYLYNFTCKTERNQIILLSNPERRDLFCDITNHGDDMFYLFPVEKHIKSTKIEANAQKCINNVVKMWTNYAKYGNPTPDDSLGVKWKPYTNKDKNYLEIGNKLTPKVNLDQKTIEFWEDLIREYGGPLQRERLGLLHPLSINGS